MALSRLENFLKSSRGKILHVNPENLDSSDSVSNDGASPFTPFKTINRALIECARYSYQVGLSNDLFGFCTILLYSGEHLVDNRPGLVIEDDGTGYIRSGASAVLNQFDINTVLDITDPSNQLYLLNSVHGGVIVPRGTSIVAQDLRKTVIRPLYVPDPRNENIERSSIFRITGASFFFSFSVLDANPGGFCYKNYSTEKYTPNFSHHKLTAFEYVDGVNKVNINDTFLNLTTTRTDLDQYYEKISLVYGATSGREIDNVNYVGGVSVDIQPVIDEFRIVGPRGDVVGISSIISGDGTTPSSRITVTVDGNVEGISVDTSVQISGVNVNGYDGQFVVSAVPSENQIQYITPTIPTIPSPTVFGATVNIISDTISSASPYVFNVSLRSVYGMCGLHADGSKVGGFKSVVVAQFTAVSLQKDNDAFVIYNEEAGTYLDAVSVPDLYKNTKARYKPEAENFHIKVSNDAFAQLVSVFSIGYGAQIIAESGGDYSITNSNSNFGAKTFISSGYKKDAFAQDDHGYIVGVIPPEEIPDKQVGLEFPQIDVGLTTSVSAGAATTNKLYFYNQTTLDSPPAAFVDGFRIGAKVDDYLNIEFPVETSSKIVIPNTDSSYEKSFVVQRQNSNFENSISNGVVTLLEAHSFSSGEKVRVISQNGHLPDGINPDQIYYVIDSNIDNALSNAQIKLAVTSNNAINNIPILPNRKGGKLFVVSRVSDKSPGEPGHPIQWDSSRNNWYIFVDENDNDIYENILNRNSFVTGRSFILRTPDNRVEENKLYKLLYCIPKNTSTSARPPVNGFIVQESNDSSLSGTEFERYFGTSDLVSDTEIRNPKFISRASWNATEVTITTELPHKLNVGDLIEVVKVIPSGYNGSYTVTKTPSSRSFTYTLSTDPGVFTNDTRVRNSDLPFVKRKNTRNIFQIYKSEEVQKYIQDKQDGLYELTVTHSSVVPTITPFTNLSFSQPIKNLYPQLDRDNSNSNPNQTECFADHNIIGNIVVNDPKNSISRESFNKLNSDLFVGIGITGIISNEVGLAHTIYTAVDHSLSGITSVSVVSTGASYVPGTYYGVGVTTTSGGESAAFKVVIDGTQSISSIELMSGGSNYSVGNIVSVVSGIGTTTGFVPANLSVTAVTNNINNSISINGFIGDYFDYNQTYRIDAVNNSKRIVISSYAPVSGASTIIIPQNAFGRINGNIVNVNSLVYDNFAGISTLTTSDPHGLKPNTRIKLTGFDSPFYNKDVIISSVDSITQIQVNSGISSFIPPTTGASQVVPLGISPIIGNDRLEYYYSGITTTSGFILNVDDSDLIPFNIRNATVTGLQKGDYIESNGEVMRIKANIDSDFVDVYRSQFGTDKKTHPVGSVVKKINVIPVELRRNSIIRASGHTFEYVGYGAGNYSTSLPENQDREIDKIERLISQSTKLSGGTVYYTGMDENGDFYSANRKLSSSTGEQEIYDLPAPTVVAESSIDDSFNVIDSQKVIVSDSLKVDGGEKNDIVSIFNGPIVINEKLTSYSEKGIEVSSLFMKGDQNISRRYSISTDFPSFAGNYGDIIYSASPEEEGNIGWVYTTDDEWRTWGYVGDLGTNLRIFSESETGESVLEGIVDQLKFVGDKNGLVDILFDINVDVEVSQNAGFGTVSMQIPIRPINFSTSALGRNTPKFNNRSSGTRVIYYDSLDATNVDYATGISTNVMWYSIPRNTSTFSFKWFGGETELMSLTGDGKLSVLNGLDGDLEGNASTATTAANLTRNVNAGAGLIGGGSLNGQSVTLNVGQGSGITVSSTAVAVDNTVVRTFGNQTIDGVKTFTNASNTFFGNGITPIGGIIMWSGAVSSIPSGWALCNGANGTPNLRNRFIVGAGGNYNPGDTGGSDSVTLNVSQLPAHSHTGTTASAGGHVHSGSTASAGAHVHSGSTASAGTHSHSGSTATAGGHSHSGSTSGVGNHSHSITVYQTNSYQLGNNTALDRSGASTGSTGGAGAHSHSLNIDSAGAHTHSLSINSAGDHTHSLSINSAGDHTHSLSINSAGDHTHTVTVGNTGGGQSHENRPPYYALAFIMRVA
jgi:microcystin-dependent protein